MTIYLENHQCLHVVSNRKIQMFETSCARYSKNLCTRTLQFCKSAGLGPYILGI